MRSQPSRSVAVVGLGYFSRFHLDAWRARGDVRLAGICDIDATLTHTTSARLNVPGFTDAGSMMAATLPDIVDLVVPPSAQAGTLPLCLAPGRTVIVQKPFGRSLDEAQSMTEQAAAADTTLVVHENFRFQPWYRAIKRFLDDGRMGAVWQARFALRPGDGRGPDAYLARQPSFQTMPRFLVRETAVHFIDLFRWLFGRIVSVYADLRQLNPAISGEDAGCLLFGHRGGAHSVFDGNRLSDHVAPNPRLTMGEMTIEGEAGTLVLNGSGRVGFREFGKTKAEPVALDPFDPQSFGGGCVAALIDHVVQALDGNGPLENTAPDYLDVVRVAEAAYQSAAQMRRIDL